MCVQIFTFVTADLLKNVSPDYHDWLYLVFSVCLESINAAWYPCGDKSQR